MTIDTNDLIKDWKSSAAGLLSFLTITGTVLLGLNSPLVSAHVTGYITIGLALCRAWVGFLQKDAGKTLAVLPGASTPTPVPSHETPDDPAAKVVKL